MLGAEIMTATYYDQLRDPKWQKKRLEVMSRADFECEYCGAKDKTLNVHHSYYEKGLAPWEYQDESLHCLCEDCHRKRQDTDLLLKRQIGRLEMDKEQLLGYAMGLGAKQDAEALLDVSSYEVALGVADSWRLTPEEIIRGLREGIINGVRLEEMGLTKRHK